jgi:hypothetical protein
VNERQHKATVRPSPARAAGRWRQQRRSRRLRPRGARQPVCEPRPPAEERSLLEWSKKMQVGSCIPVDIQLQTAADGPNCWANSAPFSLDVQSRRRRQRHPARGVRAGRCDDGLVLQRVLSEAKRSEKRAQLPEAKRNEKRAQLYLADTTVEESWTGHKNLVSTAVEAIGSAINGLHSRRI